MALTHHPSTTSATTSKVPICADVWTSLTASDSVVDQGQRVCNKLVNVDRFVKPAAYSIDINRELC